MLSALTGFIVMLVVLAVPLSLALLRLWSKIRPRAISLPCSDFDALLYQMTEALGRYGFKRTTGGDNQIIFVPGGLQSSSGVMPITALLQPPGTAQISGGAHFISFLKKGLPGAKDQPYSGTASPGRWIGRVAKGYAGFVLALSLLLGVASVYDRSQHGSDGSSPNDVEQVYEIDRRNAAAGGEWNVSIEKTGKIFPVRIPPGSKDGDRIRLPGKGISSGLVSAGDLYVVLHVK